METALFFILLLSSLMSSPADFTAPLKTPNQITQGDGTFVIAPCTILALSPELPASLKNKSREDINRLLTEHHIHPNDPFTWPDPVHLLEKEDCYAKTSCILNSNCSAAHSYDDLDQGRIWNDGEYRNNQFNRAQEDGIKTFQNASRLAFTLIGLQAIKKHKLDLIGVPETSLYSTDGHSVDDNNAVIFQQSITDALPLTKALERGAEFSSDHITQLCTFIEATGFWNPADNILVDAHSKFWCFGQQPNNSRPQDFYYEQEYRYHGNIVCGYKDEEVGLKKNFVNKVKTYGPIAQKNVPKMWAQIIEFARNSDTFKAKNFTANYRKEMLTFLEDEEKKLAPAGNNIKSAKR